MTYSGIPSFHLICGRLTSRQACTYVRPADVRCSPSALARRGLTGSKGHKINDHVPTQS